MSTRKDLPNIKAPNFLARVREELQRLMGTRGEDGRALTVGDVVGGGGSGPGLIIVGGGGIGGEGGDPTDMTAPPTPTNFSATAGLNVVLVETDPAVYVMGRGPAVTVLYGVVRGEGDPKPTFDDAAVVAEFSGPVYSFPAELNTTWHLWVKWKTRNGVESVSPAGGINGEEVTTGKIGTADLTDLLVEAGKLADGAVTGGKLADEAVDVTKFAQGIEPVSVVSSGPLPSVLGTYTIVWGGKLYRWDGSAYTAAVPTGDLVGTITTTQIADDAVTTPKILAGAVKANQIDAGAVTTDKLDANSVTTAKLAAGAVKADQVDAGAITAKHLVVADFENLLPNPTMQNNMEGWEVSNAAGGDSVWEPYIGPEGAGVKVSKVNGATGTVRLRPAGFFAPHVPFIPVQPGDKLRAKVTVTRLAGDQGGNVGIYGHRKKADGSGVSTALGSATSYTPLGSSVELDVEYTVPVDAVGFKFYLAYEANAASAGGVVALTNMSVRRMKDASLIVDGAITANKIAANAIAVGTAAIQDGAIVNAMLGNATITDAKIAELSAAKLTAGDGTIGGNLKSSNFVTGTQGWRLMPDGTFEATGAVLRGAVYAGAGLIGDIAIQAGALTTGSFVGENWPAVGGGFYLGVAGFRAGNRNSSQWLSITADGEIDMPGLTVAQGTASFSGALSAATGTFKGALSAATGTFSGSLSAATGTFSGNLSAAGGTFSGTLTAQAVNAVKTLNIAGESVTVQAQASGKNPSVTWNQPSAGSAVAVAAGTYREFGGGLLPRTITLTLDGASVSYDVPVTAEQTVAGNNSGFYIGGMAIVTGKSVAAGSRTARMTGDFTGTIVVFSRMR